jgi:hypothetical protein
MKAITSELHMKLKFIEPLPWLFICEARELLYPVLPSTSSSS